MDKRAGVLLDWYLRADLSQRAHYLSADHYKQLSYWLGVPAAVLSLFVGTSVFASLQSQPSIYVKIAVGVCSVFAAILTGLQTFFSYSERVEKHRIAGAKYGALGRELEAAMASESLEQRAVDRIREKLDALALECPNNVGRIYDKAMTEQQDGRDATRLWKETRSKDVERT